MLGWPSTTKEGREIIWRKILKVLVKLLSWLRLKQRASSSRVRTLIYKPLTQTNHHRIHLIYKAWSRLLHLPPCQILQDRLRIFRLLLIRIIVCSNKSYYKKRLIIARWPIWRGWSQIAMIRIRLRILWSTSNDATQKFKNE